MVTEAEKLALLEEASEKLVKILEINELLKYILDVAKKGLDADRGTVFIVDQNTSEIWSRVLLGDDMAEIRIPIGKGIAGVVAETGEIINIEDAYKDERFNKEVDKHTGYHTKTILCMPIRDSKDKIVGVFQMLNKLDDRFGGADIEFLKSLSNYSATALEFAVLHQELVEKKRMEHELKIAREIQVSLLPASIPDIEGYELFGCNNSCEEVSGDYYDFFPVSDNKWIFTIADVSGKGIPASLMMATLQSHLKAITQFDYSIEDIVKLVNNYLVEHSLPDKFITFFLGILNPKKRIFEYVNAGHDPPFLIDKEKNIKMLKMGGPLIGMFPDLEYSSEKILLDPGDLIFGFTDGVTEYFNDKFQEFGEKRLKECLENCCHLSVGEVFYRLFVELKKFGQGEKQKDDVTVLMLRKK